ncbi:hypothetical protein Micbo1qcDRAFT_207278 [Microdochium bolleyi]|uniref:Uncharacterized protein n=1 Tax=Microdochium bolleyi TaxID=196109 RepID=A0A136IUH5_9PEZI|nr:hypothetical protein Micbo1qcDRAFT_207278 [Microdochium bolleyi]
MRFSPSIIVLGSALAGSAIATIAEQAQPARIARGVEPRQTDSAGGGLQDSLLPKLLELANAFDLAVCIPGALSLIPQLPPIPTGLLNNDVVTQVLSQTTLASNQVCSFSITGTAGAAVTSFLPTWYSWYGKHSSDIQSIITRYGCTSATKLVQTVEAYTTCPAVSGAIVSGITAAPSTSGTRPAQTSGSRTSSRPTTSSTPAPAPGAASGQQQAGLVGAVAAVAGFAGLVVVL